MDRIITISREFGSGGKDIASILGNKLNIPVYDKNLFTLAASQSGISEDLFYQHDDKKPDSFIYSLAMGAFPMVNGNTIYPDLPMNNQVFLALLETIKSVSDKGPCIIVGRCADYILKDMSNIVKVFITADYDFRLARTMQIENLPKNKAEELVKKMDKNRASHYKFYTDNKWGSAENYDLCINSSKIGIEKTADIISEFVQSEFI